MSDGCECAHRKSKDRWKNMSLEDKEKNRIKALEYYHKNKKLKRKS